MRVHTETPSLSSPSAKADFTRQYSTVTTTNMSRTIVSFERRAQPNPNIKSTVRCSGPKGWRVPRAPTPPCTQQKNQQAGYSKEAGLLFSTTSTTDTSTTPGQLQRDALIRRSDPKQQMKRPTLDLAPSLPPKAFIPPHRWYKEGDDDEWYSEHPAGLGWVSLRPIRRSA